MQADLLYGIVDSGVFMRRVVFLPKINPNDDYCILARNHFKNGDFIKKNAEVTEVCTSKINVILTSDYEGYIVYHANQKTRLKTGDEIYSVFSTLNEAMEFTSSVEKIKTSSLKNFKNRSASQNGSSEKINFVEFSESSRKLLAELGVDERAKHFEGQGLMTTRQLLRIMGPSTVVSRASLRSEFVGFNKTVEMEKILESQVGGFYCSVSTNFYARSIMDKLKSNSALNISGTYGLLPIILFETAKVLREMPKMTSYYESENIYFYDEIQIGLTVDMGNDLRVLTFQNTEKLLPADFQTKLTEYMLAIERGTLKPEDIVPSTFTISDLTQMRVLQFQPLINGKQSAILGIGGDMSHPDFPICLNLGFDHRILSGREAGSFLNKLRTRIEKYVD